jgi:hypothetical protein
VSQPEQETPEKQYLNLVKEIRASGSTSKTVQGRSQIAENLRVDTAAKQTQQHILRSGLPVSLVLTAVAFIFGFLLFPQYLTVIILVVPLASLGALKAVATYKQKLSATFENPKATFILLPLLLATVLINIILQTRYAMYFALAAIALAIASAYQLRTVKIRLPKLSLTKPGGIPKTHSRHLPSLRRPNIPKPHLPPMLQSTLKTFGTILSAILTTWFFYWGFIYQMIVWQKTIQQAFAAAYPNWILFIVCLLATASLLSVQKEIKQPRP